MIIFAGILLYSILFEPYSIKTEKITIRIGRIPSNEKIKIVHISDLHFHNIGERELNTIRIIEKLNPDIIAITGDLIEKRESIDELLDFLDKMRRIAQVYLVYGNWDHESGANLTDLKNKIEALDVEVLVNENVKAKVNEIELYIIGVDDPSTGKANLEKALENVPSGALTILLAHSPEIIDEAASHKIDLVLVGHTHGGQVVIPGYGPLFLPVSKEYRKYASGLFKIDSTYMYVNRGLGTSILPVRLFCPPEVTLIVLEGT